MAGKPSSLIQPGFVCKVFLQKLVLMSEVVHSCVCYSLKEGGCVSLIFSLKMLLLCCCSVMLFLLHHANASVCITRSHLCYSVFSQASGAFCVFCVCVCVSEGNMPLSCAGPLADNGRVWGENYQRHISSVWDNALLWKVRLNLSPPAPADTFLSFIFLFLPASMCIFVCRHFYSQSTLSHTPSVITNLSKRICFTLYDCICK